MYVPHYSHWIVSILTQMGIVHFCVALLGIPSVQSYGYLKDFDI